MKTAGALLLLSLGFAGCTSTPPPASVPPLAAEAQRQAQTAGELSQMQNWPAAVRAWQQTADLYALLNDRPHEAAAWHNLAQAKSELGAYAEARSILEHAAVLNLETKNTNQWWRNQIALLQVEAKVEPLSLDQRFTQLELVFSGLASPELRGYYLNELGLWQLRQRKFAAAEAAFQQAETSFGHDRNPLNLAVVEANYAWLRECQTNFIAARNQWQQALDRFEAMADARGIAAALAGLGRVALAEKQDYSSAERYLRRAVQNYRLLRMHTELTATLVSLRDCLTAQNKSEAAARVQTELDQLAQGSNNSVPSPQGERLHEP
jgi:tetratricopeptide (TPR) repeat protein